MSFHQDGADCTGCETKLESAHPEIAEWFRTMKLRQPTLHVACAFRDEAAQNEALAGGKSELAWPYSPHNRMKDGKPESAALDVFQIVNGKGVWDPVFCAKLNAESLALGWKLKWGGRFRTLGDHDHFQLDETLLS